MLFIMPPQKQNMELRDLLRPVRRRISFAGSAQRVPASDIVNVLLSQSISHNAPTGSTVMGV